MTVLTRAPDDRPTVLVERGRRRPIAHIQDTWRIEDEWWRDPIDRRYYRVVLDDGSLRTLYRDLTVGSADGSADGTWYEQPY